MSADGTAGSSPLTRGKLGQRDLVDPEAGLIPAHAGKTSLHYTSRPVYRAHPRSRGENAVTAGRTRLPAGSSPLTRGKQGPEKGSKPRERLIPAHAGKTVDVSDADHGRGAHPRSRGENVHTDENVAFGQGSSPLTRGKP